MNDEPLPRRLRRLQNVWAGDGFPRFFLTICTQDRLAVLANDTVHQRLRGFMAGSVARYGWHVGGYVLMPDHLHLLVAQGHGAVTLGEWVKALKAMLGRREFRWQPGFFDHVLRSRESETEKWEYIRHNPVRKQLVTRPEDWPYAGDGM